MSHQSLALIEYVIGEDTCTLVEVGDFLASPLTLAAEQSLYEADGVLASASFFLPLGGAVITISFVVERTPSAYLDAMTAFLTPDKVGGVSLFAGEGILRITIEGEVTEFERAVLVSPEPSLPSDPDPMVVTAYQFVASAVPLPA